MTLTKWRAANLVSAMALVLAGMSPVLPLQARETAATPATRPTPWLYKGRDVPVDTAWLFGELDNGLRFALRHNRSGESRVGKEGVSTGNYRGLADT